MSALGYPSARYSGLILRRGAPRRLIAGVLGYASMRRLDRLVYLKGKVPPSFRYIT